MIFTGEYDSPVGRLFIAVSGNAVTGLWIEGQKYFFRTLTEAPHPAPSHPLIMKTQEWLDRYFSGEYPSPSELPLYPDGSQFRHDVWDILLTIPYGGITTYGDIAKALAARTGKNVSAQAVGGAVGHNPISILIPCHRIVGADGSLTGYAGGLDKKLWLLRHENVDIDIVTRRNSALPKVRFCDKLQMEIKTEERTGTL